MINIEERKPIWIALSNFYLDTELQKSDFIDIACTIIKSQYNFDEVQKINKYEIFPVLQYNLLNVAGEWVGFDEKWLETSIIASLNTRHTLNKLGIECAYAIFKWMCKDYWEKLELIYNELNNKTQP